MEEAVGRAACGRSVPQTYPHNLHGQRGGCVYFPFVSECERDRRRRASPSRFALFCLFATWLHGAPAFAENVARKPFTSDERARLLAGELVTRPVTEQRFALRLIGGSSWQIIDAPPDSVFRALRDTRNYPRMLPAVSGAELVSEHADLRRVRIDHKKGPIGISYRLALRVDPRRRDVGFKLNDAMNSGARAAWGFLTVHAHGKGQTLLAYGVMADPGDGLIVGLARGVIQEWLLRVPEQIRKFVESPKGRVLYGTPGVVQSAPGRRQLDGGEAQQRAP